MPEAKQCAVCAKSVQNAATAYQTNDGGVLCGECGRGLNQGKVLCIRCHVWQPKEGSIPDATHGKALCLDCAVEEKRNKERAALAGNKSLFARVRRTRLFFLTHWKWILPVSLILLYVLYRVIKFSLLVFLEYQGFFLACAGIIVFSVLFLGFLILIGYGFSQISPHDWRNDPATQKQLSYLTDLGYTESLKLTKGQASDLITQYKADNEEDDE